MSEPFIVGEVSKNWIDGASPSGPRPISQLFEALIARNYDRGYVLHAFSHHQLLTSPTAMHETIIAVFRRIEP